MSLHILYLSQLAEGMDYTVYTQVVQTSRRRNPALGVSGVLLFDGHRFCQWLHGLADTVDRLMATIAMDRRHTGVRLLHHGLHPRTALPTGWRAGFVDPNALDRLADAAPAHHADVMHTLARLILIADLEPLLAVTAPSEPPLPSGVDTGEPGQRDG
jgi:Sensors of blue-light using FAD